MAQGEDRPDHLITSSPEQSTTAPEFLRPLLIQEAELPCLRPPSSTGLVRRHRPAAFSFLFDPEERSSAMPRPAPRPCAIAGPPTPCPTLSCVIVVDHQMSLAPISSLLPPCILLSNSL